MNEKVLELARQAGLKKDHSSDREYIGNFDWREFAGLIVQECVSICNRRVGNSDYNTGRMHCASDIKEHFGVGSPVRARPPVVTISQEEKEALSNWGTLE